MEEVGTVISAGDGIAKIYGLDNVMSSPTGTDAILPVRFTVSPSLIPR